MKHFILFSTLIMWSIDFAAPHQVKTSTLEEIIKVKIEDDGFSNKDILGYSLTGVALIISGFALYQLLLTKETLMQTVDTRNLGYLSELDKILIEKPELWQFYDAFVNPIKKINEGELRGFIYYKLNHFEITLNEINLREATRRGWQNYMIYCLQNSSAFREEVESILLDKGFKGIFGVNFIINLAELYRDASDENNEHNRMMADWENFSKNIRQQLHRKPISENRPDFAIKPQQINNILNFYRKYTID